MSQSSRRKRSRLSRLQPSQSQDASDDDNDSSSQASSMVDEGDNRSGGSAGSGAVHDETFSRQDREKVVGDICRLCIFTHAKKEPITSKLLNDNVFKNLRVFRRRGLKVELIHEAREKLKFLFGYDINVLTDDTPSSNGKSRGSLGYALVNSEDNPKGWNTESNLNDDAGMPEANLLWLILSWIFLAQGGELSEETLWKYLGEVGLFQRTKNHLELGDVGAILRKFEKQRYIKRFKDQEPLTQASQALGQGGPTWMVSWGPRAYLETNKLKVYQFLALLTDNNIDPSFVNDLKRDEAARLGVPIDQIKLVDVAPPENSQEADDSQMSQEEGAAVPPPPPPPPSQPEEESAEEEAPSQPSQRRRRSKRRR